MLNKEPWSNGWQRRIPYASGGARAVQEMSSRCIFEHMVRRPGVVFQAFTQSGLFGHANKCSDTQNCDRLDLQDLTWRLPGFHGFAFRRRYPSTSCERKIMLIDQKLFFKPLSSKLHRA